MNEYVEFKTKIMRFEGHEEVKIHFTNTVDTGDYFRAFFCRKKFNGMVWND